MPAPLRVTVPSHWVRYLATLCVLSAVKDIVPLLLPAKAL
jgi:hypothetical protein